MVPILFKKVAIGVFAVGGVAMSIALHFSFADVSIYKKMKNSEFRVVSNPSPECSKMLNQTYKHSEINVYKKAIVECAASRTLSDRARELKLTPINFNSSNWEGVLKIKWDDEERNFDIKGFVKNMKSEFEWNKSKELIKNHCQTEANRRIDLNIASYWSQYLSICVEETDSLGERIEQDFWVSSSF